MTNLRIAVVAGLLLSAGAASAAVKYGPPLIDLTGCCGSIHEAQHQKAQQRAALEVPDRDRGTFIAQNSCNMRARPSTPTSVDPRYRR